MQLDTIDQLIGKNAGNYHIDRLLGQGPVSSLCEAHHVSGQRVMLTLFPLPETFSSQARTHFLARFHQESAALTRLKHPAILPVYDYGEYAGYSYLVTSFGLGSSLAQVLQLRASLPSELVLEVLRRVAEALDYAHSNGVLHGALSPANILVGTERGVVQIASFGLARILTQQGLEQPDTPQAHLLSIAGTFLGTPAYMAPEIVQGGPFDASIDIYALGILLFELLSGRPPFMGETPFDVAQQYIQQPIPSLSALVPTVPAGVDAIVQKALARHPALRFQAAGELVNAFEQALHTEQTDIQMPAIIFQNTAEETDVTGPLTINWLAEEGLSAGKHTDIVERTTQTMPGVGASAPRQGTPPNFDPFAWWTNVSATQATGHPKMAKSTSDAVQSAKRRKQSRRRVVALLTVSSVAVAGLGGGGFAFARILQARQNSVQASNVQPQSSSPTPSSTPSPTAQPTATTQPKKPSPTAQPTPQHQPTVQPAKPTAPPPPQHTGTVIASTSMPVNTALNFTDPGSGNKSIMIRLPSGNFVAYSRACTHQGVSVRYDAGKLVCPAHGAVFNPAANGSVEQGPANSPLPAIAIHVNADGTITV